MVKTYQGDFKSFNGNTYTVEIWYSGGGGGTRDRIIQSIEIERQGEGDTIYDNPLRPSRCKFTMVAQSDADYSTWKGWYAFPEDSLTVAVYKGSDLHWCGRLLIDQTKFRRMDASKGYATAEFVAVDALNLIGNYDVDPTWFTIDSNRASGITLIRQILDQTGLPDFWGGSDVFIQDATSITNTTKASASVMDYIAFQEGAFIQNITPELKQAEIKYVNCKTALEMILTAFSARLQLQNGAYWLYNPQAYELTDITYDSYAKDGTKLANNSTAAHSYTVDSTTQRPKFEALPVYSWQAPVRLAEIDIDRRNYVTFEDSNATSTIASRTDIVAGTNYPLRVQGRVSFEPLSAAGYSYQYSVIYQLRITNGSAYKYWNEQNNTWSSSSYTIRRVIPNNNINEYSFSHDIVAPPTGYTTIAVIIEAVDYTAAYFTGGVWTSAASGGSVTTDYWVSICQAYTAAEPYEFEQKKTFTSTVTLAGNSQKVEKDCAFYNGKNSEIGGITVYNGSAWVTASVWSQGWNAATFDDLPQMVANNITSVYNKYLPTINLTLHDSGSYNELKSLYFDSQTWIFNGGRINLYDDTFSGEWIAIASDYSLIDTDGESDTTQKNANDNLYKQVVDIRLQQSRTDAVVGRLPDFLIEQIVNFGSRSVTADPGVDKKYPISIIYNYDATTPTMQFQIVEQPGASLDSVTLMKMADESKTSTDTLTDDDTLVVPMLASYLYRIKGVVAFSTSAVADYKFSFASPGSAFIGEVVISGDDGTGTLFRHTAFGTTQSVNVGSTSKYIVRFEAVVQNDVDRDFVFQWAQNTSDASATKVLAGSTIEWVSEAIITNILTAESGTYTMTGNDANFIRTYRLVAESGTYAMTGNDATLSKQYILTAESGTFTLTGYDVSYEIVDPDAQNFITTAGITDATQKSAINQLVKDLKTYSIWSKFKAIYPFVGGSASTHAVNLKNPGTYDLTFYGGWTHNSNGVTGNGTTGYADTGINENTVLNSSDTHISIYSRTDTDGLYCDMGHTGSSSYETNIFSKYSNVFYPRVQSTNSGTANSSNSKGLFISNRVSGSEIRAMQAGSLKVISNGGGTKQSANIFIGALNRTALSDIAFYSPRNFAFASVGDGLTDQNMTDLTTAVTTFETALSRNV